MHTDDTRLWRWHRALAPRQRQQHSHFSPRPYRLSYSVADCLKALFIPGLIWPFPTRVSVQLYKARPTWPGPPLSPPQDCPSHALDIAAVTHNQLCQVSVYLHPQLYSLFFLHHHNNKAHLSETYNSRTFNRLSA